MELKIAFLIFVISVSNVFATPTYSQVAKVSLDMESKSLEQVMDEIVRQSEFYFIFNQKQIDVNRVVDIQAENKLITDILPELFKGTNINYAVLDRKISLTTDPLENRLKTVEANKEFQQMFISGVVIDAITAQPMPGVNILIKGTLVGAQTDVDGKFKLPLPTTNSVISFSFIGYNTHEITYAGQLILNINLAPSLESLDEVIVIGYGTAKKSDLTGSVQRINATQYETQQSTNLLEMFNGTVAGFSSNMGTSAAGGGSLEIRGPTSLKADNNPLIVVDGVIFNGNISDINPSDIETVDILKDASSSAIFGARSAAGIMLITTKRGKQLKPTINFSSKIGVSGLTNHMRAFEPEEYIIARGDYFSSINPNKPKYYYKNPNTLPDGITVEDWMNYDITPSGDAEGMWLNRLALKEIEQENYRAGKVTDWYDEIFQNGIRQDYDLSLSGGTNNLRYYWSLGNTHNEGVTLGDEFKTIRSRLNLDADVTSFLKVGLNGQYADRDQGYQATSIDAAVQMSPYGQIYDQDGTMLWYPHGDASATNPLIYNTYRDIFNKTQTLFATLFGELTLPFGFSYKITFSNRYEWNRNGYFDPSTTPNGFNNGGFGVRNVSSINEWMIDNLLKWNKTFAEVHKFDLTFLFNAEKFQSWSERQENSQFAPSEELSYHALQAGINPSLGNNDQYSTGSAFMGRLNYSLLDKYLITLSFRRDGYSAFGQLNPYATFPSAAFGWRISKENFFKVDWINNLKIRASWGINGNRAIGMYEALAKLSTTQYIYGNTLATGVYSSTMANSDLRWEKTSAFNLGVDFGFFDNRISGSAEAYLMKTTDLLLDRTLPSIIGYSSVASNLGELVNKGFELTVNTINRSKSPMFGWNSSLVFSFNRNEIKHLYGDLIDVLDSEGNAIGKKEADDWTNSWFIGESIDRIWDYEVLGVWQTDEAAEGLVYGKIPGDMKLRDVNGDGKVIPSDDKIFQGYNKPQYRLGFRNDVSFLKNFEFSSFIRADLDFYGSNDLYKNGGSNSPYERNNRYYRPYWTPDTPSNEYARPNSNENSPSYNVWKNRSFIRLQDVSLSYSFPRQIIQKLGLENLKVYMNLRNYLTITQWNHWDPESGTTPMPKYFTFGINFSL